MAPIMAPTMAPTELIKEAIINHLRLNLNSYGIELDETQIRGMLDLSGAPKDAMGVIVSCQDNGNHGGTVGRVLVDVAPSIIVYTHLDEDNDGSVCDALCGNILFCLNSIVYNLDGWRVAWNGNWNATESSMDGSYRQRVLSSVLPLNKI